MDVSCPQCRTEYEFEDARIPDDGLTVKCTQCSHIFRMKKRVAPPAELPNESQPEREWRLRQPSGNIFNFRHLTTLQKWIVERKVHREDEISLTGEGWKRLGEIVELASFFQVVEEASRNAAVAAPALVDPPASSAPAPAAVAVPPPELPVEAPSKPKRSDTLPGPGFASELLRPPPVRPSSQANTDPTLRGQGFSIVPGGGPPSRKPAAVRHANRSVEDDGELKVQGQGGGFKWMALMMLILGGAGAGGYYYVKVYQPQQQRLALEQDRARDDAQRQQSAREKLAAQEQAEQVAAKARADQEAAAAAAAAKREGSLAPTAEAEVGAAAPKQPAVAPRPRDFDQLMAEGERLRARDKAEAALALFTRAAELKPDRAEPQAAGGYALLDMEKPDQAELAFKGALQVNARYGPALIGMAEASKALGKKPQAVEYYQKYLEVLPNGPEAAVARNSIERLK